MYRTVTATKITDRSMKREIELNHKLTITINRKLMKTDDGFKTLHQHHIAQHTWSIYDEEEAKRQHC